MKPTKMMRIVGVGVSSARKRLISSLTKLGCVEITTCGDYDNTLSACEDKAVDAANMKLARLAFARQFIKEQVSIAKVKAKKPTKVLEYTASGDNQVQRTKVVLPKVEFKPCKKPLIPRKPEISYEDFSEADKHENATFDSIVKLEDYNQQLLAIKAEEIKSKSLIEQIKPYLNLTLNLSKYHDTRECSVKVGTIGHNKRELLQEALAAYPSVAIEYYCDIENKKIKNIPMVIVCLKDEAQGVVEELGKYDFKDFNVAYDNTAREIFDREIANIKVARAKRDEINVKVVEEFDNMQYVADSRLLEDFYNVKLQMLRAEANTRETKSSFVFEGWLPDNCIDIVSEKLTESDMALAFLTRDAEDSEVPPTFLEDNAIVTPYQSVTNMFSAPMYNEVNPNPFVAFFFVLFFGVMISDAGYGLILVIASAVILGVAKPRKHEMSMIKILLMGGISTIFWGIMFGGYFGIDQSLTHIPPVLFNPINDPMSMLFLSLGLGLTQMLTGMAINAYSLFKQKKPWDAIFGVFSWYVLLIGVAMLFIKQVPKVAGIVVTVLGLVGLMVGGALHAKGIKKVGSALGKLYGLVNFFSDLMSYTRLFGLGLATSVIAMVFNQLAAIIIDINLYIGIIVAPVILVVGHTFNLFINTLGAYVHNSRLQFVEFFGRFYTGGGKLFTPLGSSMKYYNFTLEEVTKQ